MQLSNLDTLARQCEFGQLETNDPFFYQGQLYRKEGKLSALLIRWANDQREITELVSHRFFPEIVVELPDDSNELSGSSASFERE